MYMWLSYEAKICCDFSIMIAKSLQNFRALNKLQAELYFLKVENLDACIRPLFANKVLYHGQFVVYGNQQNTL